MYYTSMPTDRSPDEDLRPCPFCGCDGDDLEVDKKQAFHESGEKSHTFEVVRCSGCGTEGPAGGNGRTAENWWNEREGSVSMSPTIPYYGGV